MSKETEPIRSRRELRAAQSEKANSADGYPSVPLVSAPTTVQRPAAPAPSPVITMDDAVPAVPRERSSQTRARDRAALRAYKELVEQAPALPSRRTLRQAQLDAERAPITSVNPVVPPAVTNPEPALAPTPAPLHAPTVPAPTATPRTGAPSTAAAPTTAQVPAQPTTRARASAVAPATAPAPEAANAVVAATPVEPTAGPAASAKTRVGRRSAVGAQETAGAQTSQDLPKAPATSPAPKIPEPRQAELSPVTTAGVAPAPAGTPGPASPDAPLDSAAVIEPTVQAPPVPEGSYYPVSAGPASLIKPTPSAEELRKLAQERAEAERAAILKERAAAKERLAAESAKSRRLAADPTATNNLAMVTPLEFMDVPGVNQPVLRGPITTHVPIVTRTGKTIQPSRKKAAEQSAEAQRFDAALAAGRAARPAGSGNRPLTSGRSGTLQRAQALVETAAVATVHAPAPASPELETVARTQMPPMPADYAHGLEPLDAVTAGLGRTHRNMLIQWGSIILGGAAFVVGAVLFITGLNP